MTQLHTALPLAKKCNKCKKEGRFAQLCRELSAEGSQVTAAVEQETLLHHDMHPHFGSVKLDSVSGAWKKSSSLMTLDITLKDEQIKADTGAEVSVISYELSKEILIVELALWVI